MIMNDIISTEVVFVLTITYYIGFGISTYLGIIII